MSDSKVVSVAYVTKWATTRGILVVRGAEEHTSDDGTKYLTKRMMFVSPKHWTTDKAEAEERYRSELIRAERAALKRHKAAVAAINAPPKYSEESK